MDHVAAYQEAHGRVAGLVERYPDVPVDTCPGWQVRDVVAHLTGLASGWVSGDADRWRRHIVMPSYQAPAEPVIE